MRHVCREFFRSRTQRPWQAADQGNKDAMDQLEELSNASTSSRRFKFSTDQIAASLDKRDPALVALEGITNTVANGDSQQILAELNSVGTVPRAMDWAR